MQPKHDINAVPYPNEVPLLTAIRVTWMMRAKQACLARLVDLPVKLDNEALLATLVILVWPINVEKF